MKQYTDKDQTAKLIELGFPEPSSKYIHIGGVSYYSIGELIGFLCNPVIECLVEVWRVEYDGSKGKQFIEKDLIDALYKACLDIKDKGMILYDKERLA